MNYLCEFVRHCNKLKDMFFSQKVILMVFSCFFPDLGEFVSHCIKIHFFSSRRHRR